MSQRYLTVKMRKKNLLIYWPVNVPQTPLGYQIYAKKRKEVIKKSRKVESQYAEKLHKAFTILAKLKHELLSLPKKVGKIVKKFDTH